MIGDCDKTHRLVRGEGWGQGSNLTLKNVDFLLCILLLTKWLFYCQPGLWLGDHNIYRCDWFPKWFRLYFCKICITLLAKVARGIAKKGHKNRKWIGIFNSIITKTYQKVYRWNCDISCDILRDLGQLLIEVGIEVLTDHVCQKYSFFFGRIKDKMWYLRILIDGIFSKWVITLFQAVIASGKKLLIYLEERHLISWKVLRLLFWLYKGSAITRSLSLR